MFQALQIERKHRHLLLLRLADYPQDDMLGVRYNPVNFGAEKSPGSQKRCAQIDGDGAGGCIPADNLSRSADVGQT